MGCASTTGQVDEFVEHKDKFAEKITKICKDENFQNEKKKMLHTMNSFLKKFEELQDEEKKVIVLAS